MSVIIRLQNLPWSANALDIRQYFHGLSIPEGGVHIVGGEQGDAFIAFSTDEDARQAMMADGGKIKEVKLKLLLSSRAEMQKVIETARQQTLSLQNFMNMPAPQQAPLPAPPPPTHMMGATAVVGHLHLPPSPAGQQHVLSNNIPAQHSPVTQAHPLHPAVVHPHHPVVASGPPHTSDKKDSDRRVDNRGEKKRERSRSRSRERRRNSRDSRDKDRDRHRGSRRRSRSRSRDRRRRDRSRDRSRSRDRRDRRRGDKDNSSKDNKDKQNGNDVVVVGQFPGRSGSKEERPRSSKSQPSQPPMVNGVQPNSANVANAPGWSKNAVAPGSVSPPSRQPQDHPANMPPGGRMLGNFPPGAPFPFPNTQDHEGWIPPRHPGMVPPQGRFDGGFRGGPPGRPRPNRFEDGQGPPEFPHDGPFPPRGRDRPPFEDGFRGGGHRGGFNPRDNPRGQRSAPHTCVEIRNVPTSAAYRDIREFFQGMHVLNIKMINDEQGRKTGIAYIKFTSLDQKEAALSMNGMTIHDSHLEVLHLDDQIYDDALDSFHPNAETHIVALHNLPPYANEQDIRRLFQGARILNIVISRANSPRSPQAYVQFSTQQEGRRAIQASGKLTVDGKEIFVERSSIETLLNSKKLEQDMGPVDPIQEKHKEKTAVVQQRKENSSPLSSDVVLLKNLPLNVNDRAILDFFSDVGLVPQRIHIMLDKTNSPFGDAFCEFLNVTEGARALAKHNNMLGNKEITVKTVSRHELEESLGIIEQKRHEETKHPLPPQRPPMPQGPPRNGLMPPSHPGHMGPMAGPPMRGGHMGEFMGRGGRGGFFGDMRGGPHMRGHRGMHHGGPPMMVRPPHPQQMLPPPSEGPTLDTFGTPGCVIELQNVPYKAEIEEIIEYFNGFDVTPANIIRRYNDAGLPTGDARISFRSPAEAQRALEDLKYKTMRDRPIYMSII